MFAKFSVRKPYTVLVGVVLVIVLGVVSFMRMTTDLLPDMELPYVIVVTTDPGASPEEVETDVTAKIEAAMATTSNIKNITSNSSDNYSMVMLEYEQSANMDSLMIEIQQSLDQLKSSFPDGVGSPMIMQINPDMLPILIASADVQGMNNAEISEYVTKELTPVIESIEGVASVTTTGTLEEHVNVTLDKEKIDDLNKKLKEKIAEQFEDAAKELDKAEAQIKDGKEQLNNGAGMMADQVSSADSEITNQKVSMAKTELELNTNLTNLNQMKSLLETVISALEQVQGFISQQQANSNQAVEQIINAVVENSQNQITKEQLQQMIVEQIKQRTGNDISIEELEAIGIKIESPSQLPGLIAQLNTQLIQVNGGIATITEAQTQIGAGKLALDDAAKMISQSQIQGLLQMSNGYADLVIAASQIEQGKNQLATAKDSAESSVDLENILSLKTLGGLLVAQNFSMPAGYITEGNTRYLIRVGDKVESVDALKNVMLIDMGMDGIDPIRLSDVATIEVLDNSAESYSKVNGNPAIMLSIEKQTGYSTGDVTKRVLDKFESLKKENDKLRTTILMNQGVYIDLVVDSVVENLIVGAILAIIVLVLFLKDFMPTLVIACSIPLSLVFAIVLMYFTDISLNLISLSGLALGVGMLVDNSIVVIENIYRFRSEGYSVRKAAVEGASQVTGAIIGSTLTTVCVFAPIIFTDGITRQLFVDIALTIAYTLGASLFVAMTFVPMMASITLKKTKEIKHSIFDKLQEFYGKILRGALKFKALVLIGAVVLLVLSAVLSFSKGFSFINMDMETGQLQVTVSAKEDQILTFEEISKMTDEVVNRIVDIEGISTIGAMSGGSALSMMGGGASGGSGSSISLYVLLDENTKIPSAKITEEIKERTKDIDCKVNADNGSSSMTAMFGSGLSIQVKGRNLEKLQDLAGKVAEVVRNTEGTKNVKDGLKNTTDSFTITVDKDKAAKYSMTVAQVFQLVFAKMASDTSVTTVSTDIKDYKVYVQSGEQADVKLDDIKEMTFAYTNQITKKTEDIKLSEIADFKEGKSLSTIARTGQTRYINVTAGIDENHNVTLVSSEIKKAIQKMDIPEGYSVDMAGEDETINESMGQLGLMLLLSVIFIYLIMVAQFQSLLSPFIIMFTIPLAFTGGFAALFFTGNEVSVIAMIGFIMLAGIIVNNGIVLVDYMNQLRREGMGKREAVVQAGKTRLRPVLMTALTTILAMSTMALGLGQGSEMMVPMAIVEVGGLIYGTLLTLFVVPCIYDAFNREKSMVEEEL